MRAYVIAMESEAAAVRPALTGDDRLYVSGIGKVNAAMATQKAIDEGATEIVNAGVCGGFDSSMEIGDVFEVARAVQYDFDLSELNHTSVGQLDERTSPYFDVEAPRAEAARAHRCPAGNSDVPEAPSLRGGTKILGTGDHFRNDDADLPLLRALGVTLRDMEGAAVAQVCEKNKIPCRLVKSVTNVQGKGSMTGQYADNLAKALATLTQHLLATNGAPMSR